jgi:RHS repeat-associated protein
MKSILRKILCIAFLIQGTSNLVVAFTNSPVPSATVTGPMNVSVGSTVTYTITVSGGFIPNLASTIPNRGVAETPYWNGSSWKVDVYWYSVGTSAVRVYDESEVYWATSGTVTIANAGVGPVTISGGVSSRCQGSGSTIFSASAQNATSYSWGITSSAGTINNGTVNWYSSFNGLATISVTAYGSGGSSSSTSKQVNVIAPNVVTITTNKPTTICQGDHITLSVPGANPGNWTGESSQGTLEWYYQTSIAVNPAIETTYYFIGTESTCGSPVSPSITIYVTPTPTISGEISPVGFTSRCQGGGSDSFYAPATYNQTSTSWSITPEAGTISSSGIVTWNSGFSGDATITYTAHGCNLVALRNKVIAVEPLPTASASNQVICSNQTTSISITNPNAISGTTYTWTVSPGAVTGASAGSGPLIAQTLTNGTVSAVNVVYTITPQANGCNGPSINVTVTVNPKPLAPIVNAASRCGSGSVTLTGTPGTNGNTLRWYINSSTPTVLFTGLSYSPTISSTTNYYVSSYNTTTQCESVNPRVMVTATVNPLLGLPTPTPGSRCGTGVVALSSMYGTNGNNVRWYAAASGGTPLATSLNFTTPTISATTTYYISSYNTSTTCESSRVAIIATINSIPNAPTISGNERFGPGSFSLVAAGGGTYTWYNPANTVVSNVALYTTSTVTATTPNYAYAKTTVNSCTSPAAWVTVNVYPDVIITATSNAVFLNENVTLDAGFDYATFDWRNGGASLGSSRYLVTNIPGNYTVTVSYGNISKTSPVFVLHDQLGGLSNNYIVSNSLQIPIQNAETIKDLPIGVNSQSIQYFDGLGRPIQTVLTQGSPGKKDIIHPVTYDQYGRESKKYNPFVSNSNNGRINNDPLGISTTYANSQHFTFYNNGNADKIADDTRPFTETIYEPSPLNRPVEQFGMGSEWYANNKSTKLSYLTNRDGTLTGEERVIAWKVDSISGLPVRITKVNTYTSGGYYKTGQLSITSSKDEHGREAREYTNKAGQVILKKVQYVDVATLSNKDHWAQTYYIYDKLGQLRYVLQPELSKTLHASGTTNPTTTQLNNYAFQYKYDGKKRMTEKKVPSGAWIYMVYDNRDRLVLTQDGVQRAPATKFWSFTKYDLLNRPILTGLKDTTAALTQAQMQAVVDAHYNKLWARWGESFIGAAVGNVHGYTNLSYPVRTKAATLDIHYYLSATYYDNYNFLATYYDNGSYLFKTDELPGDQIISPFMYLKNQVTGSKVKVLDGGTTGGLTWLKSANYYDDRYRIVQSVGDNYKGGTDRSTNVYDFAGKVLKTKTTSEEKDVTWKDISGVVQMGNRLIRTATVASGAASLQMLGNSQNGWLEVTVAETNTNRYIGFNDTNPDVTFSNIDYAFYLNSTNLKIIENNSTKLTLTGVLVPGDVLKIERVGSNIYYYRNGVQLSHFKTGALTTPLMVDVSMQSNSATLAGIRTSFSTNSRSTARRFDYDHAGRLLKTYHSLDEAQELVLTQNEYNELGQLVDKKLHSTGGNTYKQSVDYRYNIRGWLSSMNNAELTPDASNDDTDDFFGMELAYNEAAGTNNTPLYNGNISAMKWSNNQALGAVKAHAYNYAYDPLNRILDASFIEKAGSWTSATNNAFSVNGFVYDQNGNIKNLTRINKEGNPMDVLSYTYGTNNQLLKVVDTGDKFTGFVDGTNTGNDYTYNANGNMITDQNKGITVSMTYNFLNLPELVTRGTGNTLRYIYDATGRKLAQVASYTNLQKQTDYVGEWVYENDYLQFVNHEEGRVVYGTQEAIYQNPAESLDEFNTSNASMAIVTQNGTEKYVRVTSNGAVARTGLFPIGDAIAVEPGQRYRIRAKGYRTGANSVHLMIKANGADLNWPGATLASSAATEAWVEQEVVIPVGANILDVGVVWNTVTSGQQFFLNELEIIKLNTGQPEYQYHLKDHLGNVRVTFTTKEEQEESTATLEVATANDERAQFLYYDDVRLVNSQLFDKTKNGQVSPPEGAHSLRLSGSANEKTGLAKSLAVVPGDKIQMEVYAKYVDPVPGNRTTALNDLIAVIASGGAGSPGTVIDGAGYAVGETNNFGFSGLLNKSGETGTAPKAFLNYLVFNQDFDPQMAKSGYRRLSELAKENGVLAQTNNGEGVAHERLNWEIDITEPGYVYIWLSNEEVELGGSPLEVYFDDFKVTHVKSPVIQSQEYYPFGLTFNSYKSESSVKNKYLYNGGAERQENLDLGFDITKHRTYEPTLGRWLQNDPLADLPEQLAFSPYQYAWDNPIRYNDPNGDCPCFIPAIPWATAAIESLYILAAGYIAYQELGPDYGKLKTGTLQPVNEGAFLNNRVTDADDPNFNSSKRVIAISIAISLIEYIKENYPEFIGLDTKQAEEKMKKMNSRELQAYIRNLDTIVSAKHKNAGRQLFGINNPDVLMSATIYDFMKSTYSLERGLSPEEQAAQNEQREKGRKANELLNNHSNLEQGTYVWNGKDWVIEE